MHMTYESLWFGEEFNVCMLDFGKYCGPMYSVTNHGQPIVKYIMYHYPAMCNTSAIVNENNIYFNLKFNMDLINDVNNLAW